MRIDKMTASFGKLWQKTLTPGPGLNILEAPNESGKSTWCAFLRTMLYGLPTRERGTMADKNRYAPWDGSAMQGSLELEHAGRSITLTRDTARAASPMGRFSAVYSGTAEAVPDLTAADCGETLLGIPREVFERSAFIRQAGLAVDQSPELERRIAALLSTGEEGASFTEVYNALKGQLNRRRHNRTGLLPTLEAELAALESQLERADRLQDTLRQQRFRTESLALRHKQLQEELSLHAQADAAEQYAQANRARIAAEEAAINADTLLCAIERDELPGENTLRQLSAAADALQHSAASEAEAEKALHQAEQLCAQAEQALAAHPMAPQLPEEIAAKPLPLSPQPKIPPVAYVLCPVLGAALAGAVLYFTDNLWLALSAGLLLACISFLIAGRLTAKKHARWEEEVARLREERDTALAAYTILYKEAVSAREQAAQALASRNAVADARKESLRALLGTVSLFAPAAASLDDAGAAIRAALSRRLALEDAKALARETKLRYDILQETLPAGESPANISRPDSDPSLLRRETAQLSAELSALAREESRTEGELRAMGDHSEMLGRREDLLHRRETLQMEYDALALAMEALSDANAELQSRFSPELGREAGRIFSALSGGKYDGVLLDRDMNASASSGADPIPRSAALLSQGGADQLYLALRLAICRLVLPKEKHVPLILDDALTSFDDERLGFALEWLLEESRNRQILLFTCQSREGAYLAGRSGVTHLHL